MQPTNFQSITKSARAAARDILRARKVSALLGYLRNQKASLTSIEEAAQAIEKRQKAGYEQALKNLERAKHMFQVATSTNDPDLDVAKEVYEAEQKAYDSYVESREVPNQREVEDFNIRATAEEKTINDKIAEYEAKIEKWNTGESKVNYDEMVSLANTLVEKLIAQAYVDGSYEGQDGDTETVA